VSIQHDLRNLKKTFGNITKHLDDEQILEAFEGEGKDLQRDMRSRIHDDSGNLSAAVVVKRFANQRKGAPAVFVAIDRRIAPHAHLVEYGHGGPNPAPPHPFFRPAIDGFRMKVGGQIKAAIQNALRKRS